MCFVCQEITIFDSIFKEPKDPAADAEDATEPQKI
jgi:hypothetical protein